LFYAERGSTFLFGSELKALLAHPAIKTEIDATGLAELFGFRRARARSAYLSRQLAAIVGCPQNTAQIYRKAFFEKATADIGKQEQRIRALLAENPMYTLSQLARRAKCSYKDAKRWLERIQVQKS